MKKIKVQIMTNYSCNFKCEYCYLGSLRKDQTILDHEILAARLSEIEQEYQIETIGILGGEPTLIGNKLNDIIKTVKCFSPKILVITNLSDIDILKDRDIEISTSLNLERSCYNQTRAKLLINNNKNLGLNIVVTPSILKKPIKKLINELEQYRLNTELIRYSASHNNDIVYDVQDDDFSVYLKQFIIEYLKKPRKFKLNNIQMIEDCIEHKYSPLMDSVIFITPHGKFASIKYYNNKEDFCLSNDILEFKKKAEDELNLYRQKCSQCKYFKHCYAEHLKLDEKCSGLLELLNWYEENIYKNDRTV